MLNPAIIYCAIQYAGITEVQGPKSDPTILRWINRFMPDWTDDSSLAWCSIFANIVADEVGAETTLQLNPMVAKDWRHVGEPVALDDLQRGDIVIFHRGEPTDWRGHVAFFMRRNGPNLTVFGGNQSNAVRQSNYPVSRFMAGRRLRMDDGAYPKN
ncbi:TIGR02594 family protein [Lewinella sp. JB7]|uniref:TIGR02594 family protein n=1 Tax=Lewinella sp. JB7 TaxID=2962887 RepID=UPI0020C9B948|nr:TIGR02594 family protein [Lewinella sp. JB7]MCP9237166.1 TIGR02594 family protein [Lewinella sp. JB7]